MLSSSSNLLGAVCLLLLLACNSYENDPISASDPVYGALVSNNMSTYFYPKIRGNLYVFQNVLSTWPNGVNQPADSLVGGEDSLYTLGYIGPNQYGDSIFAVSIRYRTRASLTGRGVLDLSYIPTSGATPGAFIDSPTPLSGTVIPGGIYARAVSPDSLLGAVSGRAKTLVDDFTGLSSLTRQTDTLYFTSYGDVVELWQPEASSNYRKIRTFSTTDFSLFSGWSYGTWLSSTTFTVTDDDILVSTPAGSFDGIKISVSSSSLNLPLEDHRFYAHTKGLVKESSAWWVTTNGTNRVKHQLHRVIKVIVTDWEEHT